MSAESAARQEARRLVSTSVWPEVDVDDRLVDALAAAIRLHDLAVGQNNRGQWEYVEVSEEQMQALSDTLSALREGGGA